MTCLAKHAPLENLRSFDRSMQSPSCADGCLAGDMYLDVFMCTWMFSRMCTWMFSCVLGCFHELVQSACT